MKGELYVRKNAWEKYDDKQIEKIMDFNEGYKNLLLMEKQKDYVSKKQLLKQLMQDIKI